MLAGALGIALAAAWLTIGWPTSSAIAHVSGEADAFRAQLANAKQQAAQLPALRADVQALGEQVKRYRSLPPRSELDAAFKEIGQLCERSGVRAYQFTQEAERRDRGFVEQPCKLKFRGDFLAAATLVHQLESTSWLSRMRGLSVRRVEPTSANPPPATDEVMVELTLNLYFAD